MDDCGRSRRSATPFSELNDLLTDFVARVRSILRTDLVGVYLTGSFAPGGATGRTTSKARTRRRPIFKRWQRSDGHGCTSTAAAATWNGQRIATQRMSVGCFANGH